MSQQFFIKFSKVLFGFLILLVVVIASSEFLVLFFLCPSNQAYYFGYLALLAFSAYFGVKCYREYNFFRESLEQGLLIPSNIELAAKSYEPEILDIPEDTALAVCVYYHNGATLMEIAANMGLDHGTTVRRFLQKGLGILLKEHRQKEVET